MKIVLSGVETNNKGAELMLYAILQEIERKFPDAIVYAPTKPNMTRDLSYVNTKLDFRLHPSIRNEKILKKLHLVMLSKKLNIYNNLCDINKIIKHVDYFIDGSGFFFSDQFNIPDDKLLIWNNILSKYKRQGTKIILLPQAFGPIKFENTKKIVSILNDNATLIFPRENTSYNYLYNANVNTQKIEIFPDFTNAVQGTFPSHYKYLENGICIIPNYKMIEKGGLSFGNYVSFLTEIVNQVQKDKHKVYLLNHEGIQDRELCYKCQEKIGNDIDVVDGLNALEVKGLISKSYLCITARFHGVVSALNSGVPCLATSWSHKYQELFNDYKIKDCILDINEQQSMISKINYYLNETNNKNFRENIIKEIENQKNKTQIMWKKIWES